MNPLKSRLSRTSRRDLLKALGMSLPASAFLQSGLHAQAAKRGRIDVHQHMKSPADPNAGLTRNWTPEKDRSPRSIPIVTFFFTAWLLIFAVLIFFTAGLNFSVSQPFDVKRTTRISGLRCQKSHWEVTEIEQSEPISGQAKTADPRQSISINPPSDG